jgi:hypothetical protein
VKALILGLICCGVLCWVFDCLIEWLIDPYEPQMPVPPDLDDS